MSRCLVVHPADMADNVINVAIVICLALATCDRQVSLVGQNHSDNLLLALCNLSSADGRHDGRSHMGRMSIQCKRVD